MLKYAKFVGANTDHLTAQSFVFPRSFSENTRDNLRLAVIISCSGEDVFTKVRQVSQVIEDAFFIEDDSISLKLNRLQEIIKKSLKDVSALQILLVCWKMDVLYILSKGSHKCYLNREDKVLDLTGFKDSGELTSGYIKEGDRVLLINCKSLEGTPEGSVEQWDEETIKSLINTKPENLEEEANLLIARQNTPKEKNSEELSDTEAVEEEEYRDLPKPIALVILENIKSTIPDSLKAIDPEKTESLKPSLPSFKNPLSKVSIPSVKILFNKKILLAAGALVIILAGGYFGWRYFLKDTISPAQNSQIAGIRDKYNQALSLKDSDQKAAMAALTASKTEIEEFLKKNNKNSEALELKKHIEENEGSILKVYQVSEFPVFLSLDLIKEGFDSQELSFSIRNLLVLDKNQKSLVSISTDNKIHKILAGQAQLGTPKYVALNGSNAFVYSEDKGLVKVDIDNQKASVVSEPDKEWGNISSIFGFGSNVYLLDTIKNQIWKYVPTASGYSSMFTYVKDGQNINFSGADKLFIDYSVWVIKKSDPEIIKFTAGNKDFFSIANLDKPLTNIGAFFVTEEKDAVYILDKENSRIIVLKKNGEYQAQYRGDKFATAVDLAADEVKKKIYLLEGGKIYEIEMKE